MRAYQQALGITSMVVTHDIEEALLVGRKIMVLRLGCNRSATVIDNPLTAGREETELHDSRQSVDALRRMLEER